MNTRLLLSCLLAAPAFAQQPAVEYRVVSTFPKFVTADIEFRDPAGVKWPVFFYGKPIGDQGAIRFDVASPAASFTLVCDKMAQEKGDQSRKVLGTLPMPLTATLTVQSMGAPTEAPKTKGSKATHTAPMKGTLELAGKKVPFEAQTGLWIHDGKGDEKNVCLMLDGRFQIRAADLGLKSADAIAVRFGLTAYPPRP